MLKRVAIAIVMMMALYAENPINERPQMIQYLMTHQVLGEEKFFLFDVGASEGIASYWSVFGKHLSAIGFDPLVNECERLNRINRLPDVLYVPTYIVSEIPEMDHYQGRICGSLFSRSSAVYYLNSFNIDYVKQHFNMGAECVYSENKISLDRYCLENDIKNVDFIKVDTDGADYAVLRGADRLLQEGNVLGLYVESQFHGEVHPYANTFRNIDRFLAKKGFMLFDLSTWRYTKAQLPGTFSYQIPAQTVTGQISWGDALYLKDFVFMKSQGEEIPTVQLIKMACLQEIFGLPDCAAELLATFREQLSELIDVDQCLNALARDMALYPNYKIHMSRFRTHREAFFPH